MVGIFWMRTCAPHNFKTKTNTTKPDLILRFDIIHLGCRTIFDTLYDTVFKMHPVHQQKQTSDSQSVSLWVCHVVFTVVKSPFKLPKLCKFCDVRLSACNSTSGSCHSECERTAICPDPNEVCVSIWWVLPGRKKHVDLSETIQILKLTQLCLLLLRKF